MKCPCCLKGELGSTSGTCPRCHTYIPPGHDLPDEIPVNPGRHWRRPPDQNPESPYSNYVRTKEDKL